LLQNIWITSCNSRRPGTNEIWTLTEPELTISDILGNFQRSLLKNANRYLVLE
jgi:hypothetical protein